MLLLVNGALSDLKHDVRIGHTRKTNKDDLELLKRTLPPDPGPILSAPRSSRGRKVPSA